MSRLNVDVVNKQRYFLLFDIQCHCFVLLVWEFISYSWNDKCEAKRENVSELYYGKVINNSIQILSDFKKVGINKQYLFVGTNVKFRSRKVSACSVKSCFGVLISWSRSLIRFSINVALTVGYHLLQKKVKLDFLVFGFVFSSVLFVFDDIEVFLKWTQVICSFQPPGSVLSGTFYF